MAPEPVSAMTVRLTPVPRVLGGGLVVAIAGLLGLHLIALYIQVALDAQAIEGAGIFVNLFYIRNELSIPAWFSSLMMFLAGVSVALLGLLLGRHRPRVRLRWLVLAAVLVFLSADEMASIHEYLSAPLQRSLDLPGFLYYAWVIPYAVLALGVALVAVKLLATLPPRVRWRIVVAGVIFVAGALGIETMGGAVAGAGGRESMPYRILITFEELAELCGMALFLHTVVAHLVELVPEVLLPSAAAAEAAEPATPRP